jgi:hypothetical protein
MDKFGWMYGDPAYMVRKNNKWLKTETGTFSPNYGSCICFLHFETALKMSQVFGGIVEKVF